ncbi:hypothetical protein HYV73_03855 [Candidatus Uhrbacteria bacterium]|nr:hypothetical protein [Candidatus Uhrbacteria bacterium]
MTYIVVRPDVAGPGHLVASGLASIEEAEKVAGTVPGAEVRETEETVECGSCHSIVPVSWIDGYGCQSMGCTY